MVGKQVALANAGPLQKCHKRKGRGPAKLKHLTKIKDNKERVKVIYNDKGQPIGVGKKDLASYAGMVVKYVPVTYKDWHKVPGVMKEDLWNAIQVKFDVDPKTEKDVLSSMARSWRSFKTTLTRSWIYPFKDNPELLEHPPTKYKRFIDPLVWDEFVQNRLSKKFQRTSKLQSERRAKNKYNHRLSKKGYAGLAEELKEKMGSSYKEDRDFLWTKARQDKDGEYGDDATKEVAEKMFALRKQVEDGCIVPEGSYDILTMALGPEKPGRVRGLGYGVTPTGYFKLPRRGSKRYMTELESKLDNERKKRKEVEQIYENLQAQLAKSQNELVTSPSSDKVALYVSESRNELVTSPSYDKAASCSGKSDNRNSAVSCANVRDSCGSSKNQTHNSKFQGAEKANSQKTISQPLFNIGKDKKCILAIDSKTNIVAEGIVSEMDESEDEIDNVYLGEHNEEKNNDGVDKKGVETNEIGECVKNDNGVDKQGGENNDIGESEKNDNGVDKQGGVNVDIGCALVLSLNYSLESMETVEIKIPIEKEIFGEENVEFRVFKNNLSDFCAMEALDINCIATYMRHLYEKFERSREIIKFFNPESFCAASKVGISRLITKRLQNVKGNQICFIPYNIQVKSHWVLIVIDCSSMTVFWLDSSNTKPDFQTMFYINTGLNSLLVDGTRTPPTWNSIKCPKQLGNDESGYFVMKFMRELMEDPSQSIETKIKTLAAKETYTIEEINEVRSEFIEFIVEHLWP